MAETERPSRFKKAITGVAAVVGLFVGLFTLLAAFPNVSAIVRSWVGQMQGLPVDPVDVFIVLDESPTMQSDHKKIIAALSDFSDEMYGFLSDVNFCITGTDRDYYHGKPVWWTVEGGRLIETIDSTTPNKALAIEGTISMIGDGSFSNDEQGLGSFYDFINLHSEGCIRGNGTLAAIVISDEDERSVGGRQAVSPNAYQPLSDENYPSSVLNLVRERLPEKDLIWNSIIIRPGDFECIEQRLNETWYDAFDGTLYAEMSNLTDGYIGSICHEDFAEHFSKIKVRILQSVGGML